MDRRSELGRALVAHTYAQLPSAVMGSAACSVVFGIVAGGFESDPRALPWVVFQLVGIGVNLAIYVAFMRGTLSSRLERAHLLRRVGVLFTGVGWGIGGALWPMHDGGLGLGIAFCLAGLMAGATQTLAGDPAAYVAFALSAIAPDVLVTEDPMRWVAALLAIFFVATCSILRQNALTLRSSLELRWENAGLLADAIREREAAEAARADAERAARSKTRFLAAASHDLRQPVQALALFVDVLARTPEPAQEERRRAIDALARTSDALRAMLEGLFDLSRLDAGVTIAAPRAVPLGPMLDDAVAALRDEASAADVAMVVGGRPCTVLADPALLARVVHNLGSNAVRHGRRGRVLFATRRRGDRCVLEIWDQGPGIAEADRDRIFEEFVQLENPERDRAKGLGLGLAMVRRICVLHGWTLSFESRLGKGTVFRVGLPRADDVRPEPSPASAPAPAHGRVLLVEDDGLLREAAKGFFEAGGYRVHSVASGDAALEALAALEARGERPDVLVTDHRLPGALSGAGTILRLRERGETLGAVLVTGDMEPPFARGASPPGVVVLRKPVSGKTLLDAVGGLVSTARREPAV